MPFRVEHTTYHFLCKLQKVEEERFYNTSGEFYPISLEHLEVNMCQPLATQQLKLCVHFLIFKFIKYLIFIQYFIKIFKDRV